MEGSFLLIREMAEECYTGNALNIFLGMWTSANEEKDSQLIETMRKSVLDASMTRGKRQQRFGLQGKTDR